MFSKIMTVALAWPDGSETEIQTDISKGLPYFDITGMGDTAVREASRRVRRAIVNSGFEYPKGRIAINLAPAYIKKSGSHYDLGMAMGILTASGAVRGQTENILFAGELAFDGRVLPVKGLLSMLFPVIGGLISRGLKEIVLPAGNCPEVYIMTRETEIELIPVTDLKTAACHVDGKKQKPYRPSVSQEEKKEPSADFSDVRGNTEAKEAIMTAVAGGHSLLMTGAPGSGKTMMAERIPGILPPMTIEEKISTTMIYSYAGRLTPEEPYIMSRPFRHVDAGITKAALIGGGGRPWPGEVSFAHNGVLFMDEMLQLPPGIIELLRQPLEEKRICLTRQSGTAVFPADFIFIGAANPCPCGNLGDPERICTCTAGEIERYRSRLSGAIADRIDICIEVNRPKYSSLVEKEHVSSAEMREKIIRVRNTQIERAGMLNSAMRERDVEAYCRLSGDGEAFMKTVYEREKISARKYFKLLRVARTVADIKGSENISLSHLTAAWHYVRTPGGERV